MALYHYVLSEYLLSSVDREPVLEKCVRDKDWKNYEIQVHALKSTSGTIGADVLSDMAKEQEEAAHERYEGKVLANHDELMALYRKVTEAVKEYLPPEEGRDEPKEAEDKEDTSDDVILEFMPD